MRALWPVAWLLGLSACVGGTLSDTTAYEMLPLRSATDSENRDLKKCLRHAHAAQEAHHQKTGKYERVKNLPVQSECKGFYLSQVGTNEGYEIRAEIHDDENLVRWSVNQDGVIEEHLDPEGEADLEF